MIKINNISKFFFKGKPNEIKALQNIDLELTEGLVMLVGKSGCGKTTLLNTIGGLEKPDCGSITIDDVTITRYQCEQWDKLRNRSIGYVFQNYNLIDELTVYQNLELVLKLAGVDPKQYDERIHYALSLVGMEKYARRHPSTLSGGQQQRVGIARAVVKGARIIIADEPTGNLDDTNTIAVMELLKGLSKYCLVVVVTHEEDLAAFYADRIISMQDGKIIDDSQNSGEGSLEHRAADHVYLGDMERRDFDAEGMQIALYQDGPLPPARVSIVCQNGRILLKVDGEAKVTYVTKDSSIVLDEQKFVPRSRDDKELPVDMDLLSPGSGKAHRVFTFRDCLKASLGSIMAKWGVRRHNQFRLLYTTAIFFVIMLALAGPAFLYDRDANVLTDDNILMVDGSVDASALPQDTIVVDRAVNHYAELDFSFSSYGRSVKVPISDLCILPYSAIGGTARKGEVYIDKLLYTRMAKQNDLDGLARNEKELVGLPLGLHASGGYGFYLLDDYYAEPVVYGENGDPLYVDLTLAIAGIVDRGMPVVYLSDEDYAAMPRYNLYYTKRGAHNAVSLVFNRNLKGLQKALKAKGIKYASVNGAAQQEFYRESAQNKIVFFILAGVVLVIQIFGLARLARNQYIGKIKLYAQYRSIGVSRASIYGKISLESAITSVCTSLRGWAVASIFLLILQNLDAIRSLRQLGMSFFYYPGWFALICGAFLVLMGQIVNLLSPLGLLAHTPSKLMTKYDI